MEGTCVRDELIRIGAFAASEGSGTADGREELVAKRRRVPELAQ
jgi:hypothetical protein